MFIINTPLDVYFIYLLFILMKDNFYFFKSSLVKAPGKISSIVFTIYSVGLLPKIIFISLVANSTIT
ncbi:hypothetical protein MHY_18370 [Megamonas hypermegale ART12/1]|nr:hypothetical protein MHY_18370 [Megamonas hypermegale ART12/1]